MLPPSLSQSALVPHSPRPHPASHICSSHLAKTTGQYTHIIVNPAELEKMRRKNKQIRKREINGMKTRLTVITQVNSTEFMASHFWKFIHEYLIPILRKLPFSLKVINTNFQHTLYLCAYVHVYIMSMCWLTQMFTILEQLYDTYWNWFLTECIICIFLSSILISFKLLCFYVNAKRTYNAFMILFYTKHFSGHSYLSTFSFYSMCLFKKHFQYFLTSLSTLQRKVFFCIKIDNFSALKISKSLAPTYRLDFVGKQNSV